MAQVSWRAGTGWGVVTAGLVAWLPAAPIELLRALHAAADARRAEELLEVGTWAYALFDPAGHGRPRARGDVPVLARDGSGREPAVDGTVARVVLGRPGGGATLPITDGVVGCGAVEWLQDPSAADVAAPGSPEPTTARPQPAAPRQPADAGAGNPFAELWGQTMRRPVEAAAVRVVRDGDPVAGPSGVPTRPEPTPAATNPPPGEPSTEAAARQQPAAHRVSATTKLFSELDDTAEAAADTDHGEVVAPDGSRTPIRHMVVIGRAPQPWSDAECALVRVTSPDRSISRSHVVVRGAAGMVAARDLDSNNGTYLVRSGRRERLRGDAWTTLADGDVLDLGEGVTVRLVGLP